MRFAVAALQFLALSVPLTWVWLSWGRAAYADLFAQLALPIYGFFGATDVMPAGGRDRFINYLPFWILLCVTPRLGWRRRCAGAALGTLLIFLCHVAFVWVLHEASGGRPQSEMTVEALPLLFPMLLFSDSFPFLLWIVIAHRFVRELSTRLFDGLRSAPLDGDG